MQGSGNKTVGIGSLISLLSKSNIRYEGILYSINLEEKNIALKDVQSFGTEDRAVDVEVPASSQQYNLIVFKGDDIKDLNAIDARCPTSASAGSTRMQDARKSSWQGNTSQQQSYQNQGDGYSGNDFWDGGQQQDYGYQNRNQYQSNNYYQDDGYQGRYNNNRGYGNRRGGYYNNNNYNDNYRGRGYNRGGYNRQGGGYGGGYRGGYGNRGRQGWNNNNRQEVEIPIPKEDFDFQQALEKFNKDDIKKEIENQGQDADLGYRVDKFFDDLSSDTVQKEQQELEDPRSRAQLQRKLDSETFGGSGMSRYRGGRGRGRGRNNYNRGNYNYGGNRNDNYYGYNNNY
eukprot:TRINITY_DN83551_c0_g2_i3.p1 TRINITY_DN83551_c0_g2~~TRINITY_DN83551_c0_g2_i3.p1  ORF type:complete len:377 (+),score=41.78 TRINITY_DN83551_c0_g2_i3:105-1133(+)